MITFIGFFGFIKHVVVLSTFSLGLLLLIKIVEKYNKNSKTFGFPKRV